MGEMGCINIIIIMIIIIECRLVMRVVGEFVGFGWVVVGCGWYFSCG